MKKLLSFILILLLLLPQGLASSVTDKRFLHKSTATATPAPTATPQIIGFLSHLLNKSATSTPVTTATPAPTAVPTATPTPITNLHGIQEPIAFFGSLLFNSNVKTHSAYEETECNALSEGIKAELLSQYQACLEEYAGLTLSQVISNDTGSNTYYAYIPSKGGTYETFPYRFRTADGKLHDFSFHFVVVDSIFNGIDVMYCPGTVLVDLELRIDPTLEKELLAQAEKERAEQAAIAAAENAQPANSSSSSSTFSWSSSSSSSSQTRTTRCHSCGGDGKISCSNCSGRGYKEKTVSTPNYSGKGVKYETVKENCYRCRGSGTVDCSSCGGDGKVEY